MEYIVKRTENPDELYHYGVKGMKWGRRKNGLEKKLNKQATKTRNKTMKYEQYKQAYNMTDVAAKKRLTPTQYARYIASGSRMEQNRRLKDLKRASDKSIAKTRKMIDQLSNQYTLSYDVMTDTYTIKNK